MTLRSRLTLAAAAAVAIAVVVGSTFIYLVVRQDLRGQVDRSLTDMTANQLNDPGAALSADGPGLAGGASGSVVTNPYLGAAIFVRRSPNHDGMKAGDFRDTHVGGTHLRVYAPDDNTRIMRPLTEVDATLGRLRWGLGAVALGGIGLAIALGLLVARAALKPVHRLTDAAREVAQTRDLAHRIDINGSDELAVLGTSLNTMLEALDESLHAQRQLVSDASHELRTPLTSLRTNVELLARDDRLSDVQKATLLSSVVRQLDGLSRLVGDLVDLARGDQPDEEEEDVQLKRLVENAVDDARAHWPNLVFTTDLEPSLVRGRPARLERAVANLLDNAGKWSPPRGEVHVSVTAGEVTVRDHGPGIPAADLPRVFDRFYRSAAARARPGSGLGLAIVRQVADAHGGSASAEAAPGGGTLVRLRLRLFESSSPALT
jgi:two-component system sensor histidine kinase MprB